MKNHPHHYVSSWFVIVELSQALETGHLLLSGWYFNMATEKRKTIKSGNKGTKRAEENELALRTGGASVSEDIFEIHLSDMLCIPLTIPGGMVAIYRLGMKHALYTYGVTMVGYNIWSHNEVLTFLD
ncbi:hypothetical protein CASFOL_008126 [Castilleja foliolosa]|uniref:Uncharacterized protein n=1 Tax=Castilleja foliolosa TaxID=1961234 RepID=A0ABD3DY30_9LAMI